MVALLALTKSLLRELAAIVVMSLLVTVAALFFGVIFSTNWEFAPTLRVVFLFLFAIGMVGKLLVLLALAVKSKRRGINIADMIEAFFEYKIWFSEEMSNDDFEFKLETSRSVNAGLSEIDFDNFK